MSLPRMAFCVATLNTLSIVSVLEVSPLS